VEKTLQGISSEFDTRLQQQSHSHNEVTDELSIKIIEVRSEIDSISGKVNNLTNDMQTIKGDMLKRTEELHKRQGERIAQLNKDVESEKSGYERRFELLNTEINSLKDKLTDGTSMTSVAEVTDPVHASSAPCDFVNANNATGSVSCNCLMNSCNVCGNGWVRMRLYRFAITQRTAI
jgi:uncharacterized coiled-coil protein SlyX